MRRKLVVIIGPTASGKSRLAIELAKRFSSEVVNADSRQIYEGLVIGTASPVLNQKSKIAPSPKLWSVGDKNQNDILKFKKTYTIEGVPHHLFHVVPPDEYFSVADYKNLAIKTIYDIEGRKNSPCLVGGAGLYIWTVVDNVAIPRVPPQTALRKKLERRSVTALLRELRAKDPDAARLTGPNKRRIIRALEVIAVTEKKFSEQQKIGRPLFETLQIGLKVPPSELDRRIEARAKQMLKDGLIEEVKNLLKKYPPDLPAFSALGYRHFIQYLKGKLSLKEATEQFIRSHTQLARRQMRWFKRDKRINWLPPESPETESLLREFLS